MVSPFRRPWVVAAVVLVVGLTLGAGLVAPTGLAQEGGGVDMGPSTPTALGPEIPPELTDHAADWPAPMGNLAAQRAAVDSPITAENVAELEVAWRFPIEASSAFGAVSAPPIVAGDTVYIQDMLSNVFALDRESGEVKWEQRYEVGTVGPNGVALGYGMVYGTIGDSKEVFALDAETGEEVWRVQLSINEGVDMAPTVYDNVLYVSTVPGTNEDFYRGGQRGVLFALDAATGAPLWSFDTTTDNLWGNPRANSGGGLWYPLSIDEEGNLYFGVGNAAPWPGTEEYPNGSSRPGPNDYASSMVSLDQNGSLRWYHNAKPHDLFDLDFQLTPVLVEAEVDGEEIPLAIGAGKTGTVVAANRETGEILWEVEVGIHENDDLQEIPEGETVEVYPGILGGVETPMAYADGTVFVPVVNMPASFTATELLLAESFDLAAATGELVALNAADGSVKWQVELPQMNVGAATVANDVVFTGALDGVFRAYDAETGDELWTFQAGAGLNAPPSIAGDMVFLPAGGPLVPAAADAADEMEATPGGPVGAEPAEEPAEAANELIAFRLPADDE